MRTNDFSYLSIAWLADGIRLWRRDQQRQKKMIIITHTRRMDANVVGAERIEKKKNGVVDGWLF